MAASSSMVQVILLCTIFSFPSTTTAKDKVTGDDRLLNQIPGIAILKDVDIWKNGEITSLSKTFGEDPKKWIGNSGDVAQMSFTALCCLYSSKLSDFIRTAEKDFDGCRLLKGAPKKRKCWDDVKIQLKSLHANYGVPMLTTALNYTKIFNVRADKNVLNAFMSFHLYVNSIEDGTSANVDTPVEEKFFKNFINMKLYTVNLIEAFAVLNCSWSAFDLDQLNRRPVDLRSNHEILNELNLPETYFKREHLDPNTLFMPNVSAIRLDHDPDVNSPFGDLLVAHRADFRSEIITQSQTIVFQSIVSTVFYLIGQIFETTAKNQCTMSSVTKTCVSNAIDVLKRFNFPGLLHVKLRQVIYQNTISPNAFAISNAADGIFEGLAVGPSEIKICIIHEKLENLEALTDILKHFPQDLLAVEPEIKTVKEINQMLCDYEYEEVGFLPYDSSMMRLPRSSNEERVKQVVPILQRLKEKNCQFSDTVVVHFMLADYIITQCEALLSDVGNLQTAKPIQSCFTSLIGSIILIEDTLDHTLFSLLNSLQSTRPFNNASRQILDSILAMKLYLSNGDLLYTDVPLTEHKSVDLNRMVSKFNVLRRHHRFITNLIEHYTAHSCSKSSSREEHTKDTKTKIHNRCASFMGQNDNTQLLKCIDRIVVSNCNKFVVVKSKINRDNYTIHNLSMNAILEKASSDSDNGLSMMHELSVSWEGGYTTLTKIVGMVKDNINPKYLCKCQLIVIKAIVFIVYEYLKTIIITSSSDTNYPLYRSNVSRILKDLTVLGTDFVPVEIFRVYEMIVDNFQQCFQGEFHHSTPVDKNALIRVIQVEQYYLGMQKQSSGAIDDEIVRSLPDHTLGTSPMSHDMEIDDTSGLEMDGKKNINHLLWYLADIEDIRSNLTNAALVLEFKRMSNLQI